MQETIGNTAPNPPISVISPLLHNLKLVLEEEQAHMDSGRIDNLEVYARKKMQALAQINLFTKNDNANDLIKANEAQLREISELLRDNMKKLNFRIDAIGEITEKINLAVEEAESDGTYEPGNYYVRRRSS